MDFTTIVLRTCIETLYLTGSIILVGFLLGILRSNSIKNFQMNFGFKAIMITGILGVVLHETSHLLACLITRHKVTKVKLFQKPDENGTMGYVEHSYNPNSAYQQIGNFFIGVAPIFGGILCMLLLMKFLLPSSYNEFIKISIININVTDLNKDIIVGILSSYWGLIKSVFTFKNLSSPSFYLFLFISVSISSHISLSKADIEEASKGMAVLALSIFIFNIVGITKYIPLQSIIRYNIALTGFLIVALIFSTITFLISLISIPQNQK